MKRIIAVILSAVLLTALLPVFVYADTEEKKGTVYFELPILLEEYWSAGDGIASISRRVASGKSTIYASAEEDASGLSFSASFDPIDLSAYTELSFDISAKGENSSCDASVILLSNDSKVEYNVKIGNENSKYYFPIPEELAPSFSGIEISVKTKESVVSYITISDAQADDTYTYSYLDILGAPDILSENSIVKTPDRVTVIPENNRAVLSPSFTNVYEKDRDVLVWISLENPASGTVSAIATYDLEEDKEETFTSLPLTATTDGTLSFVVPGGFREITFEFLSLSDISPISIVGAGSADMGERTESAGTITSCRFDGKELTVSGSLSADASLEYIGSKLLLFKIPVSNADSYNLKKYEPCAQSSFSTKFSVTCDAGQDYASYFYKLVLDTEEGYLSVGELISANCGYTAQSYNGSVSALYNADAADVFETNAASTIIDVYAGTLLSVSDIYSSETYNYGSPYHFNRRYLEELSASIKYYTASGIKVYLRIYSDKEGYVFDYNPDDMDNLAIMCAVSSFLSEKFPQVQGYIPGKILNTADTINPAAAEKNARLICVFAECIKSKNHSAAVLLPFSENGGSDLRLSASMLHYYLSKYSSPSTVILYESSDNFAQGPLLASRLAAISAQYGCATDGSAALWNVPSKITEGEIVNGYKQICISAANYGLRFAALNLSKIEKTKSLYDSIKKMMDEENISSAAITLFDAEEGSGEFSGTYPLWDFTSSYDTQGWVAGGSFSSPISEKGSFSSRTLLSSMEKNKNSAGILIARIPEPVDMKETCARISFSIASDTAETAHVSIIFGSGDSRAEFSAEVKCNTPISLLCDLSEYTGANSVSYSALIVRNVDDARAEISMIELCSKTLNVDEMKARFSKPDDAEHHPMLYASVIFIAAVTVTVFSVLAKKRKSISKGERK